MKCLNCGEWISDWRVLKHVRKTRVECEKCGAVHNIAEVGAGLGWTMPFMGVVAAAILSFFFMLIETSLWLQVVILVVITYGVVKTGMRRGLKLTLNKPGPAPERESGTGHE